MRQTGLLLVLAAAACLRGAPEPRQSEAMERSARMLRQLERLEADLHQGTAETTTYSELVERHTRTEQIACNVTDAHVLEISRLAAIQESRMARQQVEREGRRARKRKVVALARVRPSRMAARQAN
jgi:hypothetical protein